MTVLMTIHIQATNQTLEKSKLEKEKTTNKEREYENKENDDDKED